MPPPIPTEQVSPFGLSIAAAVEATGSAVSRTRLFELIRTGEVDARKVGRRTVVIADSLRDYLLRQPHAASGPVETKRNRPTPPAKRVKHAA